MREFSVFKIQKNGGEAKAQFVQNTELPSEIPVSTPFTFPFFENREVVLCKDKNGWWNPLGGHIESGESWEQAVIREAYEEAGVEIGNLVLFGYVRVKQSNMGISGYPPVSVLPFTTSGVIRINEYWQPRETLDRIVCDFQSAFNLFQLREDNRQMEEIFRTAIQSKGY